MIHQEITNENKCGVSDGSKGGAQWARPLLFWMKKEEITDGIKAGRASKTKCPPLLAQGLHSPLGVTKELFVHSYKYGTYW